MAFNLTCMLRWLLWVLESIVWSDSRVWTLIAVGFFKLVVFKIAIGKIIVGLGIWKQVVGEPLVDIPRLSLRKSAREDFEAVLLDAQRQHACLSLTGRKMRNRAQDATVAVQRSG